MWQRAIVRFGAVALVATSCWTGRAPETAITNESAAVERDPAGTYYCSIQHEEYKYPRFPCVIRKVDGRLLLAKLAGSQRFRGEVKPLGDSLSFDGEFYCPWGDCTRPLHGVFEPVGRGALRGTFRDESMVVLLEPAPETAFGTGYGGVGYGGVSYGGALYPVPLDEPDYHGP